MYTWGNIQKLFNVIDRLVVPTIDVFLCNKFKTLDINIDVD